MRRVVVTECRCTGCEGVKRGRPRGGRLDLSGSREPALTARARGLAANLTTWRIFVEAELKAGLDIPKDVRTYVVIRRDHR
jgi:hypothetical protein